ncbi:MAG: carbon-nitrogen hydrolase family protein [Rhodospirillales bacterium]
MTGTFRAALVQITAGPDPAANAETNVRLLNEAVDAGADFVMFPEVCNMIEPDRAACRAKAKPAAEDETLTRLRAGAAEHGAWVLVGSIVAQSEDTPGKLANRSFLIDDKGGIAGSYDKMHLFDVDVGTGDVYRESDTYRAGSGVTLVPTPWGVFGMTVCYDMRFPHLYRDLARAGAVMLSAPSAFTRPTGEAHWHVLLRARAIECGAFVFAPAQTGDHAGGRKTYGHSLAVGPWGEVLADGGTEPGITCVEIDTAKAGEARARIPSLQHDRAYSI